MTTQLGVRIRELRIQRNLLLREIAAKLNIDTSIISKVELSDRIMKKDLIVPLAEILGVTTKELLTLWLADQIIIVTQDEDVALSAISLAEKKIKNNNRTK